MPHPFRFLSGVLLALAAASAAAAFPSDTLKLVVPTAPGGSIDAAGRLLAEALSRPLGVPVIVDNRSGAGGVIGVDSVVRAPPDGQRLVIGISATLAVQPAVRAGLPYDALTDLAPIGVFAQGGLLVAVPAGSPVRSLQDLKTLSQRSGELTFGSGGQATFGHLTGEFLKHGLGVPMRHIPYRGAAPAVTDLAAGLLDLAIVDAVSATPFVQSGKIRVIATAGPGRHIGFPQVPTLGESGLPFQRGTWVGLFAPAAVPPAVLQRLRRDLATVAADPAFRSELRRLGFTPVLLDAPATSALLVQDIDAWKTIAEKAAVRLD